MELLLTAANVEGVFVDYLFRDAEPKENPLLVDGIVHQFGFHPERLLAHKGDIAELLSQLPAPFMENQGGGWSFLNACMTQKGEQWGEHSNIEQLLALGIATRQAKYCLPRDMWKGLPGGMPYFMVMIPALTPATA